MPRLRLHKSSIVLGLLLACGFVLTMIPGRVVDFRPSYSKTFEHGWPYVYLRRQAEDPSVLAAYQGMTLALSFNPITLTRRDFAANLPMWGVPWLCGENWSLWNANSPKQSSAPREFSPSALLLDIVISLLILAAPVAAWEFRRRRRPRLLCFGLADMLAAVTIVSVALGWVIHMEREFEREVPIAQKLETESGLGVDETVCVAPVWLRALIGEKWMPEFTWRIATVAVYALDVKTTYQLNALPALPYLNKLVLSGSYGGGSHFPFATLRSIRQLETLVISDSPRLDAQDVSQLVQLTGLKKLAIPQKDRLPSELLQRLESALAHCKIIDADEDW